MSVGRLQPSEGATPPVVFNRWMNVVSYNVLPPVGPSDLPTASTRSQGIAPGATKFASRDDSRTRPQTVLVSRESCQATRMIPGPNGPVVGSSGLGPKKCVVSCSSRSPNNVASGVNSVQATFPMLADGWHA